MRGECYAYSFTSRAKYLARLYRMCQHWALAIFRGGHSAIWCIAGLTLQSIRLDWMHVVCLGILQNAMGNALWELYIMHGGTISGRGRFAAIQTVCKFLRASAWLRGIELPFYELAVPMIKRVDESNPAVEVKSCGRPQLFAGVVQDSLKYGRCKVRS